MLGTNTNNGSEVWGRVIERCGERLLVVEGCHLLLHRDLQVPPELQGAEPDLRLRVEMGKGLITSLEQVADPWWMAPAAGSRECPSILGCFFFLQIEADFGILV